MKFLNTLKGLVILLITTALLISCSGNNDKVQIKALWEKYLQLKQKKDGINAAKLVDKTTLEYYNHWINLAKFADSIELANKTIPEKIMVLLLRNSLPASDILNMTGRHLLEYSFENDMFGQGLENSHLTEVFIDKDAASAVVKNDSSAKKLVTINFSKESDGWKINFSPLYRRLLPQMDVYFKQELEKQGKSEKEFLYETISESTSKIVQESIWEPLLENPNRIVR